MSSSGRQPALDPAKLISMSVDLRQLAESLLPPAQVEPVDPIFVRRVIDARRERDRHFEAGLFADPAWDMLLELHAARSERRQVSVTSLSAAAGVPLTTGLRWITVLCSRHLIVRTPDPGDSRRIFITITDDAFDRLNSYFEAVQRRGDCTA